MTQLEELLMLTKIEEYIILNGKIETENDFILKDNYFYDLQDKYNYGWDIVKDDTIGQISMINKFKEYIIEVFAN